MKSFEESLPKSFEAARPFVQLREEDPELQEIGPVGVQRVARQAALELQVREEVQQMLLKAILSDRSGLFCNGAHESGHRKPVSASASKLLARWRASESERPEPEQRHEALAVPARPDHIVETRKRLSHDLDALRVIGLAGCVR